MGEINSQTSTKCRYWQCGNGAIDIWMRQLSPAEFKMMMAVARLVFGFQQSSRRLKRATLITMTGLSPNGVRQAEKRCLEAGALFIDQSTKPPTYIPHPDFGPSLKMRTECASMDQRALVARRDAPSAEVKRTECAHEIKSGNENEKKLPEAVEELSSNLGFSSLTAPNGVQRAGDPAQAQREREIADGSKFAGTSPERRSGIKDEYPRVTVGRRQWCHEHQHSVQVQRSENVTVCAECEPPTDPVLRDQAETEIAKSREALATLDEIAKTCGGQEITDELRRKLA